MSDVPGSPAWRDAARERILAFARLSKRDDGGFFWLGSDGTPEPDKNLELWINTRMTYVFALAHLGGSGDGDLELASHGVRALRTLFHDDQLGGWFTEVDGFGAGIKDGKFCYEHSFVLLAASVASAAGAEGADELLAEIATTHVERFWDAEAGRCFEERSRDWETIDPYRGANSNMHTVEAYIVAADVTGDDEWRARALSICERVIGIHARSHEWRIPEHYDADWTPIPNYNEDRPADPFRPFGVTPGHAFEWARLLTHLAASTDDAPEWLDEAAEALFARAVTDAVDDDVPGLPYTTDWHGVPVVEERFHWVISEAVLAAEALHVRTGDQKYRELADRWWREIESLFVDKEAGSWIHELSPTLGPSNRTWHGKPDAYHAFNAVTLPSLPLAPSAVMTIATLAR